MSNDKVELLAERIDKLELGERDLLIVRVGEGADSGEVNSFLDAVIEVFKTNRPDWRGAVLALPPGVDSVSALGWIGELSEPGTRAALEVLGAKIVDLEQRAALRSPDPLVNASIASAYE